MLDNQKHTFHNTLGYRLNNVSIAPPRLSLPRGCANKGDAQGQSCNWGTQRRCPSALHQPIRVHDTKNTWGGRFDTVRTKNTNFVTLRTKCSFISLAGETSFITCITDDAGRSRHTTQHNISLSLLSKVFLCFFFIGDPISSQSFSLTSIFAL